MLIYGQLNTTASADQTITLYHRVNPSSSFSVIGSTQTNAEGFYDFTRAESAVLSNRSWYVRARSLPGNVHSRTVHEHVAAAVSLTAPTPPGPSFLTGQPIMFTGEVSPHHAGGHVLLQEQTGSLGASWTTLKEGLLRRSSRYSIADRFKVPGDYDLRALFSGDSRNTAGASDSVTVVVQQKEKSDFTIATSSPIIDEGSPATIFGVLGRPRTTTPAPSVGVTLWGREREQPYLAIASAVTAADGSYSFDVSPVRSEEYEVRTTLGAGRVTQQLYEGVRDVVTLTVNPMSSVVGGSATFTGTVSPDKAGHAIELQQLGTDGLFHAVATSTVSTGSVCQFVWTFGNSGTHTFRLHITGGPENVGGHSAPVAVAVALPPVQSLPVP